MTTMHRTTTTSTRSTTAKPGAAAVKLIPFSSLQYDNITSNEDDDDYDNSKEEEPQGEIIENLLPTLLGEYESDSSLDTPTKTKS